MFILVYVQSTDTKVWFSFCKGKILYLFSEYKSLNKKKILEERKVPVENTLCAKTC